MFALRIPWKVLSRSVSAVGQRTALLKNTSSFVNSRGNGLRHLAASSSLQDHEGKHNRNEWEKNYLESSIGKAVVAVLAAGGGYAYYNYAKQSQEENALRERLFKEDPFISDILRILPSEENIVVSPSAAHAYLTGARLGSGPARAILLPESPAQAIECLRACVQHGLAVIIQGRNTGITGGSVPRKENDRETVVINLTKLNNIVPLYTDENGQEKGGEERKGQVLCMAGAGIGTLQRTLATMNRNPHSVLGSLFLNPTVSGGIAFGSGGTLLRVGPSYTDRVLYVRVTENNEIEVINNLGIPTSNLGELLNVLQDDGKILNHYDDTSKVEMHYILNSQRKAESEEDTEERAKEYFNTNGVATHLNSQPQCRQANYPQVVCNLDSGHSRFNADTSGSPAVRSEGKCLILASVHDSYPAPSQTKLVWVGCKTFEDAARIKREAVLATPQDLPVICEYVDKETVEVVRRSGSFLLHVLNIVGMKRLPSLWHVKERLEGFSLFQGGALDKIMHHLSGPLPVPLPSAVRGISSRMDHNLIIQLAEFGDGELVRQEERLDKVIEAVGAEKYECANGSESTQVFNFRLVVAVAFKSFCLGSNVPGVSFDYALRKNDFTIPVLPDSIPTPLKRLRYMHFGCNVVHEDLAFEAGYTHEQLEEFKLAFKKHLESVQGARLPAEHGHGIEYKAPPQTIKRWMKLDPRNMFNPGVGHTSTAPNYKEERKH